MTAHLIMVQGTASHAGKSLLVAALCRIFRQDGYTVAPFKAQNMSLNSFVTPDGGEIGRAQAVQAEAAGIPPSVYMNPVLLKPEADSRSQVVLMGKPYITTSAAEYYTLKSKLWPEVVKALEKLRQQYHVVVIEGAGSPAEVNLAKDEIVNMRVARHANAPVLLIGDIERGGVFASLLGTLEILEPEERKLIKAFVINKFRGDLNILLPGLKFLEQRTGVPVTGVIPWFNNIEIAEEDALGLDNPKASGEHNVVDIAVIRVPHLSNFDDFDPFRNDKGVSLRYVESLSRLGDPDLIILPGTKTTISDLDWLRRQGFDTRITELHRKGTFIIGICGGYQMLGEKILDPERVESPAPEADGLGLLLLTTIFTKQKDTYQVSGKVISGRGLLQDAAGCEVEGYEIHMGNCAEPSGISPFSLSRTGQETQIAEGSMDLEGRVLGTYIHGLFNKDKLRQAMIHNIARLRGKRLPEETSFKSRDLEYDKLAALVRGSLNMDLVYKITGITGVARNG